MQIKKLGFPTFYKSLFLFELLVLLLFSTSFGYPKRNYKIMYSINSYVVNSKI